MCFHLQTVWEAENTNTPERGPRETAKFDIDVPVGYDAHLDGARTSVVMQRFGTGGTPWTIVIDRSGVVRMNEVTPTDPQRIVKLVERLRDPGIAAASAATAAAEASEAAPADGAVDEGSDGQAREMKTLARDLVARRVGLAAFPVTDGWTEKDRTKQPPAILGVWSHSGENLVASITDHAAISPSVDATFSQTEASLRAYADSGQAELYLFDHESSGGGDDALVGDGCWAWMIKSRGKVTLYVGRAVQVGEACYFMQCSRRLGSEAPEPARLAEERVSAEARFRHAFDLLLDTALHYGELETIIKAAPAELTVQGQYRLRLPIEGWRAELGERSAYAQWEDAAAGRHARLNVLYRPGTSAATGLAPMPAAAQDRAVERALRAADGVWFRLTLSTSRKFGSEDEQERELQALRDLLDGFDLLR